MPTPIVSSPLQTQVYAQIDRATQVDRGADIDRLISEIAKTNFQELPTEHAEDLKDDRNFQRMKKHMVIGGICMAVAAVVASLASIAFSAGTVAASALTLTAVTGMVGVTAAFNQLDGAIARYIAYGEKENEFGRLDALKVKLKAVSELIGARVSDLPRLRDREIVQIRGYEILDQTSRVNNLIGRIKQQVPERIMSFPILDPSPLLEALEKTA